MGFIRTLSLAALALCMCQIGLASTAGSVSAHIEGSVAATDGSPVANATVFVYSALLKQGYANICPTCWVDCGKHTETDARGHFGFDGLDPELKFRLLVVKDGYAARQVSNVDPAQGNIATVHMKTRPAASDPTLMVRGRVVDREGRPVPGALINPMGALMGELRVYGGVEGVDPLAVSNPQGEFEFVSLKPYQALMLTVSPRGYAAAKAIVPTGASLHDVVVSTGATVTGRLVRKDGSPIANAEVGLGAMMDSWTLPDQRVGTDRKGYFSFSNVPTPHVWRIFPTESVVPVNLTAQPIWCETKVDGEIVKTGDLVLVAGYRLAGRVERADHAPLPPGTQVSIEGLADSHNQIAPLSADGRFEFKDLPPGPYLLSVPKEGVAPREGPSLEVLMQHDRSDIVFTL